MRVRGSRGKGRGRGRGRGRGQRETSGWTGASGPGASSLLLLLRNPTGPALRQSRTEVVATDRPSEPDRTSERSQRSQRSQSSQRHSGHSVTASQPLCLFRPGQATYTNNKAVKRPRNASVRAQGSVDKKRRSQSTHDQGRQKVRPLQRRESRGDDQDKQAWVCVQQGRQGSPRLWDINQINCIRTLD